MGWILLTNDDGVDSPAILPLARALAVLAPVRIVVPSEERSWIGKAITRFAPVKVERQILDGQEVHVVGGYPADCGNLGIYSLFESEPELVVSGINLGLNAGLGFFLSSGTVGAALEARIAGIPAIAFSTGRTDNDRDWKRSASEPAMKSTWERAALLCSDVAATLWKHGFPPDVDLWSVNFPLAAERATRREITSVARESYRALFQEGAPGHFARADARLPPGPPGTDLGAVFSGGVSITPVRLLAPANVPDGLRRRLVPQET